MAPTTKRPDAFGAMRAALEAAYQEEIRRLADEYRPRILAGEFSGFEGVDRHNGAIGKDQGDPNYLRLEAELKRHPWLKTHGARAVLACSTWPEHDDCSRWDTTGWTDREIAAESMAHDVLSVAAQRGWVKPYRSHGEGTYALRVA